MKLGAFLKRKINLNLVLYNMRPDFNIPITNSELVEISFKKEENIKEKRVRKC